MKTQRGKNNSHNKIYNLYMKREQVFNLKCENVTVDQTQIKWVRNTEQHHCPLPLTGIDFVRD